MRSSEDYRGGRVQGVARWAVAGSAVVCLMAGATLLGQQASPAVAPIVSGKPNPAMNGLWDYNDMLSVDAATGQREQAPLGGGQRARSSPAGPIVTPPNPPATGTATGAGTPPPIVPGPPPAGSSTTGTAGAGGGGAGGTTVTTTGGAPAMGASGGSIDDFERSTRDLFMAERHDLVRDLIEVPELLRVRVTDEGVTFVDDLQRLRTYPTNGKLQKYQLAAAQFQARAYWDAGAFHKDIEAANNFRMTETYRVSDNGNQMFVELRIGDPKKPLTMVGVNRVYDRVGR